ncbi:MAG TPA: hypothetical protein VG322_03445, partial [Candidatus Acidoferrales bacterium]|nr:hypothetical protein [Candidatus Acidoferrales bacterium]
MSNVVKDAVKRMLEAQYEDMRERKKARIWAEAQKAEQLESPQIVWNGPAWELADLFVRLHNSGQIRAKSRSDACRIASKHFFQKNGKS